MAYLKDNFRSTNSIEDRTNTVQKFKLFPTRLGLTPIKVDPKLNPDFAKRSFTVYNRIDILQELADILANWNPFQGTLVSTSFYEDSLNFELGTTFGISCTIQIHAHASFRKSQVWNFEVIGEDESTEVISKVVSDVDFKTTVNWSACGSVGLEDALAFQSIIEIATSVLARVNNLLSNVDGAVYRFDVHNDPTA